MERVGVLVHPTRPVQDAVDVLRRWTGEHGLPLVQIRTGEQPSVAPPGQVTRCDLVVALGGDGTILKALHAAGKTGTPVLGVGYGSLGVLNAVSVGEVRDALDRFAAGDWVARHLPALGIAAGDTHLERAVNDVSIARRFGNQLVVDVYVDDELYVRAAGDGIVVATPLGSTAYSMAAGGSILTSGTDAFICTPLAMHGGCAPPIVVRDGQVVTLDIVPGHGGFGLEIDGVRVATEEQRFSVRREHTYATLVELGGPRNDLRWLRERGLISDSPRVLARDTRDVRP
jgi:NAD+ kinase